MDSIKCAQVGINYDEGLARFIGEKDIYEKFLLSFPDDKTFRVLEKNIDDGDVKGAFEAAHSLKGLTGNLSINDMYKKLVTLTDVLRNDGDIEKARDLFVWLKEDYKKVVAFLENYKQ